MKTPLVILTLTLALSLGAAACGGDDGGDTSGLDRSSTVDSLSDDEQMDLCEFTVDAAGGAGAEFECGDDTTVTVESVDSCMAGIDMNTCTVGQMEDCATRDDPCDLGACAALFECAFGGD